MAATKKKKKREKGQGGKKAVWGHTKIKHAKGEKGAMPNQEKNFRWGGY